MAMDRIKVSLDEVYSARIDDQVRSQDAIARAQQHYQQQFTAAQQVSALKGIVPGKTSIWYNSIFYMTIFGALGGLLAWGAGEIVYQKCVTPSDDYKTYLQDKANIELATKNGDISALRATQLMSDLEVRYNENPYVRKAVRAFKDTTFPEWQRNLAIWLESVRAAEIKGFGDLAWFGLIGLLLTLFLSTAEHVVSRRWKAVVINICIGILLGAIGGITVGLFIDKLYQAMGGGKAESGMGQQVLARSVGWALFGLFLAIAPGIVMRSWKRLAIGLAGGCLGGLLGGLLFDLIARVTDSGVLSRAFGIVGIGLFAALGTGLIEKAAKTGWLKVLAGIIAGKQFILYRNPTNIGSSPQCEIYLFKDAQVMPKHAAIRSVTGGFEIEAHTPDSNTFVNGQAISRRRLRGGDRIQVGSTVFEFQEKNKR